MKKNKLIKHFKGINHKVISYFFFLPLLFLVNCTVNNNTATTPITRDSFEISYSLENIFKKVGYLEFQYGKVDLKEGVTANFAIVDVQSSDNSDNSDKIKIDKEGNIKILPGLKVATYSFKVEVTGTGSYVGSSISWALNINIDYLQITKSDFLIPSKEITKKIGYTDNSYGSITPDPSKISGATVDFQVAIEPGAIYLNQVEVDEKTGVITINQINFAGEYDFTVTVTGNGDYKGSFDVPLTVKVVKHTGKLNFASSFNNGTGGSKLEGARRVATVKKINATYLLLTASEDNTLTSFSIDENNGSLSFIEDISHDANKNILLEGAWGAATAEVNNTNYVFTGSTKAVSTFTIADNGTLNHIRSDNFSTNDKVKLDGDSEVAVADIDGITYLFVTAFTDNALNVFKVKDNGELEHMTTIEDESNTGVDPSASGKYLKGARGVTTAKIGNETYVFVAGETDNGINSFRVDTNSDFALTLVDSLKKDDIPNYGLAGAYGVTSTTIRGANFLYVTGSEDDSVTRFEVANDGKLSENGGKIKDSIDFNHGYHELDGAQIIINTQVDENTYLFVAGFEDDGVSMFSVADTGELFNTKNVADEDLYKYTLKGASGMTSAKINGTNYLFISGATDNGVTVFKF